MWDTALFAVSIRETEAATSNESALSLGTRLVTKTRAPSGVTTELDGSRMTFTRASCLLASRSITDTSSFKALQTYSRLPPGAKDGPRAECPAGIVAAMAPVAASTTHTELTGAAQVTYSLAPSALTANPLGSDGQAIVRATLPPATSTTAICLASCSITYSSLPSGDATTSVGPRYFAGSAAVAAPANTGPANTRPTIHRPTARQQRCLRPSLMFVIRSSPRAWVRWESFGGTSRVHSCATCAGQAMGFARTIARPVGSASSLSSRTDRQDADRTFPVHEWSGVPDYPATAP
jgi:hypothetical protein